MFTGRVACLKVKGCGLVFGDTDVLDAIAITASRMVTEGKNRQPLKADGAEGLLTTEMKRGAIGTLIGYVFKVEIESDEAKRVSMEFVLSRPITEEELEFAEWVSYQADPRSERAAFN